MIEDNFKVAYKVINSRSVFDNITNPLGYKVPKKSGIHFGDYYKTIKEVKPSTLQYILYKLHNLDYDLATDTLVALLYYYRFRKKN